MNEANLGRAVVRVHLNVEGLETSPATTFFDATSRAGQAMDLAMRVRRHGRLSYEQVKLYGGLAGLRESDLRLWCLGALEKAGLLETSRDTSGRITEVEERVGVAEPVLEQVATVWEGFTPSRAERCAIASSDHLAYAPLAESDHRAMLEVEGYDEPLQNRALKALAGVGILRRERSLALNEDVLYSPYVWGTEAVDIAEFMKRLPPNERAMLAQLSRVASEHPGAAINSLTPNERLVSGAQKVGLIDAARVQTTGGNARDFAFSPSLERMLKTGTTDVAHERKLFVAHVLYGHRHASWSQGRIRDPLVLVRALIDRGEVGPATSIAREYPLLESKGIVRVERQSNGRGMLKLVKKDVALDSLELLHQALSDSEGSGGEGGVEGLWVPGTFRTPERNRRALPELSPSIEAEVLNATIEELREAAAQAMRREVV
jgi:hypothetical protein